MNDFKVHRFPQHTHFFRDEVASDLDVSVCNDSSIGRNNRVQSGKQKFNNLIKQEIENFTSCEVKPSELYLSTSLIVAFRRGMRATSAAASVLRPPSTLSTSSRSEACTSGWRDSSYNDQDIVLEIWKDGSTQEVTKSVGLTARTGEARGRSDRSYCVHSCEKQLRDVAIDGLHGQPGLRQEVGEITALHLLSTSDLLCLGRHSLVNVTLRWRHRD